MTTDTFSVNVSRSDSRLEPSLLGAGIVNVTNAYMADKDGNPAVQTGQYVVLEMEYGPTLALSSALNYQVATGRNDWTTNAYTITQQTAIETPAGSVSGLVVTEFAGTTKEIIEDFETGASTFEDVTLTYADYSPAQDNQENPLIIWLHGGGGRRNGCDKSRWLQTKRLLWLRMRSSPTSMEPMSWLRRHRPIGWTASAEERMVLPNTKML